MNTNEPKPKVYLGDGAYAAFDGYHIILTAENGIEATDTIALEPPVLEALWKYAESLKPKPAELSERAAAKIADDAANEKQRHEQHTKMLSRIGIIIDRLPEDLLHKAHLFGTMLDLDNLSREDSVRAMTALQAGKWVKAINGGDDTLIDYTATIDGVTVRLWAAAPPDSCRVVEVEEIIPERRVMKKKLICSESKQVSEVPA